MIKGKGILFLLTLSMIFTTYSVALADDYNHTGTAILVKGLNSDYKQTITLPNSVTGEFSIGSSISAVLEAEPNKVTEGESFKLIFSLEGATIDDDLELYGHDSEVIQNIRLYRIDAAHLEGGSFTLNIEDRDDIIFELGTLTPAERMEVVAEEQDGGINISFTVTENVLSEQVTHIATLPITITQVLWSDDDELTSDFGLTDIVVDYRNKDSVYPNDVTTSVTIEKPAPTLSGTIKTYGTLNSTNGISAKLINTETEVEQDLELTIVDDEVIITPVFVDDLADSEYKLTVSGAGFIGYEEVFELDNEDGHSFNITTFYPGDVYDTTNKINFYDFHALCSYLDGASYRPVTEENLKYDLNRDGKIDKNDINNLTESYKAIVKGGSK